LPSYQWNLDKLGRAILIALGLYYLKRG
jgi:hypothetical protein